MNIHALKILKYLLDIIYIYFLLACSYMIFGSFKVLFVGNGFEDLAITSASRLTSVTDIPSGIVFILGILAIVMIFGVLHYCRKSITIWYQEGYFNSKTSYYLKNAGILTLSSIAFKKIPVLIYDFFYPKLIDGMHLQMSTTNLSFGLESMILPITFGLFLLILSQVLTQAENIKSENDLTI